MNWAHADGGDASSSADAGGGSGDGDGGSGSDADGNGRRLDGRRRGRGGDASPAGSTVSLPSNLSLASFTGSLPDLQQLAAAFARNPQATQSQTDSSGSGGGVGAGGANDGTASGSDPSRCSSPTPPNAPAWARAFSAFGAPTLTPTAIKGVHPSHSPPGGIASAERFAAAVGAAVGAAASGGVVGADDLGDAAEMQLDGILDMLDKWEQFETPDGEMPDGDLCELG
jgi:hypothetical protein